MRQVRPYPQLIVTAKGARALKAGHPWVFEGEVIGLEPAPSDGRVARNGDICDVREKNGTWQGAALLSARSKIRARIVSRNANDVFDEAFWRRRISWAWQHRLNTMGSRFMCGQESDLTCCRVLFSEADGVPGLVIDKYADVAVAQVTTFGMERLREVIYPIVLDVLAESGHALRGIYERNDGAVRDLEGLGRHTGWWGGVEAPCTFVAHENGIAYSLDIAHSQKTGFFLDQKYNRRAVAKLAPGRRVLDCFCHVGPFGLNALAGGAAFCRFVDASADALDLARQNAVLNNVSVEGPDAQAAFTCADVLEWLPRLRDRSRLRSEGGPFDLIVLDPPAFAKSSRSVRSAQRAYVEINRQALSILPRGGYLATCTCSQHMTRDLFEQALSQAAHDAGVSLKQVEERTAAPDHPILWGFPESHYLDFLSFQVV